MTRTFIFIPIACITGESCLPSLTNCTYLPYLQVLDSNENRMSNLHSAFDKERHAMEEMLVSVKSQVTCAITSDNTECLKTVFCGTSMSVYSSVQTHISLLF